ncbi:MAG: DUF4923 family protein [Firmicutes bacterium]|nr:DUF4923 family protein [Bacillota bacterium]
MKRKIAFIFVLMLFFSMGLTGCGNPEERIVGVWVYRTTGQGFYFRTFKDDGTFVQRYASPTGVLQQHGIDGTWEFNDGIVVTTISTTNVANFKLSGNKMTGSFDGDNNAVFQKINVSIAEYLSKNKL